MVEFTSKLLHYFFGHKYFSKICCKIARLFSGQIDPLIIFGRDILNFIVGLAQWRGLAKTLEQSLLCMLNLLSLSLHYSCLCLHGLWKPPIISSVSCYWHKYELFCFYWKLFTPVQRGTTSQNCETKNRVAKSSYMSAIIIVYFRQLSQLTNLLGCSCDSLGQRMVKSV